MVLMSFMNMWTYQGLRQPMGTTYTSSSLLYAIPPTAVSTILNDGTCIFAVSILDANLFRDAARQEPLPQNSVFFLAPNPQFVFYMKNQPF